MPKLTNPTGKPKALRAVKPNAGIEADFAKRLGRLIDQMHRSVMRDVLAQYRRAPPAMAQDTPAKDMADLMRTTTRRWQSRFDKGSEDLAKYYATAIAKRSDATLRKILRDSGFSVEFKMTAAMRDVLQATIAEQVGLIRSIPQEYLGDVQGLVMRSIQSGRDLATLSEELIDQYGVTRKRAALISIDQNNKATSAMQRARQTELGIDEAIWMHSHAGRQPRPTHVANDGKKYSIAQGWWDPAVRQYIWPGMLIRCRCTSRPIIPGFS